MRGVSEKQLRRGDLKAPYRGVRTRGALDTVLDRARAYATKMKPEAFFS